MMKRRGRSARTVAIPIPLLAPVTTATLPPKLSSICVQLLRSAGVESVASALVAG